MLSLQIDPQPTWCLVRRPQACRQFANKPPTWHCTQDGHQCCTTLTYTAETVDSAKTASPSAQITNTYTPPLATYLHNNTSKLPTYLPQKPPPDGSRHGCSFYVRTQQMPLSDSGRSIIAYSSSIGSTIASGSSPASSMAWERSVTLRVSWPCAGAGSELGR